MKRICVYCGSNSGCRPDYLAAAGQLGKTLAEEKLELVYGGASIGLMGAVADAALQAGGKVIGIIPHHLKNEVAHRRLTELHVVDNMHQRKKMMLDYADGMIALPGGFGTLEEIFEAVTWGQLRLHRKPCGLLNVAGYYDQLLAFLAHAAAEKFIRREYLALLPAADTPMELLARFRRFQPPTGTKWAATESGRK
ncbi:MAG: TIGR00730 family Rossman fold protein [Victivallales bacterium]|nr:TIGR00730 family Rossman fold protein [Victivallales bacterium]